MRGGGKKKTEKDNMGFRGGNGAFTGLQLVLAMARNLSNQHQTLNANPSPVTRQLLGAPVGCCK